MKRSLLQMLQMPLALLAIGSCLLQTGCTSTKADNWQFAQWDVREVVGLKDDQPELPQVPIRLVSSWVHTINHRSGAKPTRGFGGRMVFFGSEQDTPIRVDGQLVVYAFDETDRPDHETHPTRRFVFPAEQFVRHESESEFGPSYSVWLPWDEVGGPQKNISLITRFEPRGGALIVSEPTKHLLPGSLLTREESQQVARKLNSQQKKQGAVTLASHHDDQPKANASASSATASNATSDKRKMSTVTLKLPQRLGKKSTK